MPQSPANSTLLQLADRCVKCGMCLPTCPTYGLFQNEAESPRGRIALIQAVAQQSLQATKALRLHLDHCLGCRTCEKICPAQMAYGELLDRARADWRRHPSLVLTILLRWAASRSQRQTLRIPLRWLRRLKLLGPLTRLARMLRPDLPDLSRQVGFANTQSLYPAAIEPRGKVMLFSGCTGPDFDADTLRATIKLLTQLGYVVDLPQKQNCCGAMHLHHGDPQTAMQLGQENMAAFGNSDTTIVYVASGCGAQLKEYADLPWENEQDRARAQKLAGRVVEVTHFIAGHELPAHLSLAPLDAHVAVYTPCSMRNVLRQTDASLPLLQRIPHIQLHPLANTPACCGAAGTYMLTQPQLAAQIRQPHLDHLKTLGVSILTTTNIGCALHLARGAEQQGLTLTVKHPITLLAEQLRQVQGPATTPISA
ncbi:MAG: (Fe-S)-binding protein [Gammaproteobacteria bacterium]